MQRTNTAITAEATSTLAAALRRPHGLLRTIMARTARRGDPRHTGGFAERDGMKAGACGMIALICIALGFLALLPVDALAQQVRMSSYLGVMPGQSTTQNNPPIMQQSGNHNGLGADCPGGWTSIPIRFQDQGVLQHGIGHHPPETGEGIVSFDLDVIRSLTCSDVVAFTAVVGIDRFSVPSAGANGAQFRVLADGVQRASAIVENGNSPSVQITVDLQGVQQLSLRTSRRGAYFGNHACWGLATLSLAPQPNIYQQPLQATSCLTGMPQFTVEVSGSDPFTYLWHYRLADSQTWTPLADGPVADVGTVSGSTAATLAVDRASDPFAPSGTAFRCVVTNACGSETSNEATLTVTNCDADFNCDGVVNSQDFYDFLIAFFELRADFNRDGVTNSQDLFDFLDPFLTVPPLGC